MREINLFYFNSRKMVIWSLDCVSHRSVYRVKHSNALKWKTELITVSCFSYGVPVIVTFKTVKVFDHRHASLALTGLMTGRRF